jgi:hypothetical protein
MTEEKKDMALEEKEKELKELEEFLARKEVELDAREKALKERGPSVSKAVEEKKPLTKDQQKLIEDGCKAYGIDARYLDHARIDPRTKEAVLVTVGGKKVRYARDMEVEKLDPVAVDGISRKKPRHVMGKKR